MFVKMEGELNVQVYTHVYKWELFKMKERMTQK